MTTKQVKQLFIDTLENEGFTVFMSNALPSSLPKSYVTFSIVYSADVFNANDMRAVSYLTFEVKAFDSDIVGLEDSKYKIRNALEKVGFKADGIGWDILTMSENERNGWDCDFNFLMLEETYGK